MGVEGVEDEASAPIMAAADASSCFLHKFRLYETRSKYYVVGRNKDRTIWRVLKIDRLESTELDVREDSATYSDIECFDLLKRIHEGNRSTGGLKLVTKCYGIVGFIKFLGPYYMLLITKRRQIGSICGHNIYAINKTEMIPIPNSSVQSSMSYSKNENRYKKLLCTVDLTKDFFFSYSYHVMHSVQKNLCNDETGHVLYETMFVWNEFLTRGIRNHLKSSIWTVALVYGFFKQAKLFIDGKNFKLTLIARRSRHYAGTRYLKRGVNEKGRVANDVETEQIVFEDVLEEEPWYISSVVQNRGSIPLFWSQETSRLNIKPDIILQKKDINYEATRLHFENLVKRYGNPIIILNLIKTHEKRPRESILRTEFATAIDFINKDLEEEKRLKFLHWDLHKHCRSKATNVLSLLGKVAEYALNITGIFYCQLSSSLKFDSLKSSHGREQSPRCHAEENKINGMDDPSITTLVTQPENAGFFGNNVIRPPKYQKGVLRTNCIDCLDRTNVAQFAYGLAALGNQLHALGLISNPRVDLDSPLADDLMSLYEAMGDTLALQYGGSAAHNKIFSERRGQWKAATQSQEFFRTLQRYYSNAYMDAEKQDAINIFLGYFQPQQGKPALWELDSDQHYSIGRRANVDEDEITRKTLIKRSLSDGNIFCESKTPVSGSNGEEKKLVNSTLPEIGECASKCPESTAGISTSDLDACYSRYLLSIVHQRLYPGRCLQSDHIYFNKSGAGDELNCTNFLDLDWLSSSGNSIEEELSDRSALLNSPLAFMSSENVVNEMNSETTQPTRECESSIKVREQSETELSYSEVQSAEDLSEFSDSFVHWVKYGETLCH